MLQDGGDGQEASGRPQYEARRSPRETGEREKVIPIEEEASAPRALLGPHQESPKPKSKRLSRFDRKTISAREFRTLQNYIEGIKTGKKTSLRKSAIKAGYTEAYASMAAKRIEELVTQNQWVRAMMEESGMGLQCLVKDLGEIRNAVKKDAYGEHPDYDVRQRNVEFRALLLDALPPKRMEVEERSISIVITADTIQKIREIKGPGFFRDQA
jgi:hypothetical protein